MLGSIISGIKNVAGAIGSVLGPVLGFTSGQQQVDSSEAINAQNIAYQKELNQQIFEREDNAYQRAVSDAESAGLSPLAVSGGANAGGIVSAPQAQQYDAGAATRGLSAGILQSLATVQQLQESQANVDYTKALTQKTEAETGDISFEQAYRTDELTFLKDKEQQRILEFFTDLDNRFKLAQLQALTTERGQDIQRDIAELNNEVSQSMQEFDWSKRENQQKIDYIYQQTLEELRSYLKREESALSYEQRQVMEQNLRLFESENLTTQEKAGMLFSLLNAIGSFVGIF